MYVFDGGRLTAEQREAIVLQTEELSEFRYVAAEELDRHLPERLLRRVRIALGRLTSGEGAAELENGAPAGTARAAAPSGAGERLPLD